MQSEKPSDLTLPEKPSEEKKVNLSLTQTELALISIMVANAQIPGRAAEVYINLRNKVNEGVKIINGN